MRPRRPDLSECVLGVEDLAQSVRLTEIEQYMLLEVAQAARWWLEDKLGKSVSAKVLRRRQQGRRRATKRFDGLFENAPRARGGK